MIGRYYAMDRDKRWERIKIAVDGLVQGVGEETEGGEDAAVNKIKERYEKKETDEFLKPIILSKEGRIKGAYSVGTFPLDHRLTCSIDDDTLFFFNYRSDRMREIVSVFGLEKKPMEVEVPKNLVRGLSVAVIMCS